MILSKFEIFLYVFGALCLFGFLYILMIDTYQPFGSVIEICSDSMNVTCERAKLLP
jgi:hypothetical protein